MAVIKKAPLLKFATAGEPCPLLKAIRRRHTTYKGKPRGLLFFEMRTGTGWSQGEPSRIDAFHMEETPSKSFLRTAYEIKISRSDFLSEIRKPEKRKAAMRVSNKFFFVTPEGLVDPGEIPLDCGLLELQDGTLRVVVKAPYRDSVPPTWGFFAAIARRVEKGGA